MPLADAHLGNGDARQGHNHQTHECNRSDAQSAEARHACQRPRQQHGKDDSQHDRRYLQQRIKAQGPLAGKAPGPEQ